MQAETFFDFSRVHYSMGFAAKPHLESVVMPDGRITECPCSTTQTPTFFTVSHMYSEELGANRPIGIDDLQIKPIYKRQGIRFLRDAFAEWAESKPKRAQIGWTKYLEWQRARQYGDPKTRRAVFPDEWLPPGCTEVTQSLEDLAHHAWDDGDDWEKLLDGVEPPEKGVSTTKKLEANA